MNTFNFGFQEDATGAMNAMLYGNRTHNNVTRFIQQQRQTVLPTGISQAASVFLGRAQEAATQFMSEKQIDFVRKVVKLDGGDVTVGDSTIQPLWNIVSMQRAGRTMVNYVMANQEVRKLYHRGRAEGYGELYLDKQPGIIGDGHYDYMKSTDGMVDENGESVVHYFDIADGDRELTLGEKVDIADTWACLQELLDMAQQDPTSPTGELL